MSADIVLWRAQLEDVTAKIDALEKQKKLLRQMIADASARFAVGDLVTTGGDKAIYSIKAITPGYHEEPRYFGARLKKDGTPGARVVSVYAWRGELRLATADEKAAAGVR